MRDIKKLEEELAPSFAEHCQRCELSGHGGSVIWGEGNPNAPIMAILDNPGAREDREGQAFVCGTRETLQLALMEAGIPVDQVYVTYLLKCRPRRAYDKPLARSACAPHLEYQLEDKQPKALVALGNVVVQTLFGDEALDVKQLRGKWQILQELPTVVSYHPLAARRRPNLMPYLVEDLKLLTSL